MGVKQSKRSVDITETSTKGEIEGFGNEGKVEKIIDGVVEKVAANGHVEGDLQNGIEPLQNGVEPIQNGEAATVTTEKTATANEESGIVEGGVNGQIENGEETINDEGKKSEVAGEEKKEKEKDKKKEKKEKVVKKKFSFRNFSFSKRDKSKPPKDEKSPEKVDETPAEETVSSSEKDVSSPTQTQIPETPKAEETTKLDADSSVSVVSNNPTIGEPVQEIEKTQPSEILPDLSSKTTPGPDDLPPPLPASPPPSEPVEGKLMSAMDKLDLSEPASENPSGEIEEVTSPSVASFSTVKIDSFSDTIKDAEQKAMETGQLIEEKATNLLKTVEERVEESLRAAGGTENEIQELCQNKEETVEVEKEEEQEEQNAVVVNEETDKKVEVPVEMTSLSPKTEETTEKIEEAGGEMTEEMTATPSIETSNPDSLELPSVPPPPPVVEPVTGE